MYQTVDDENANECKIRLKNNVILRDANSIVYTMIRKYNYKINVTKRRRVNNSFETLPFGHE